MLNDGMAPITQKLLEYRVQDRGTIAELLPKLAELDVETLGHLGGAHRSTARLPDHVPLGRRRDGGGRRRGNRGAYQSSKCSDVDHLS